MSKYRPVPRLEDYGIDPKTGFLPHSGPLQRLGPDFVRWEELLDDLQHLLVARILRAKISQVRHKILIGSVVY